MVLAVLLTARTTRTRPSTYQNTQHMKAVPDLFSEITHLARLGDILIRAMA